MDTPNLKAFLAVARLNSFSAAAEELHLTQPAISKRIQLLEEDIGLRLFDRIGRSISVTQHGDRLLPLAKEILNGIELARDQLLQSQHEVGGRLALAISHHIGLHRLPPVLKAFSRRYPQVSLDIQFTDSELAYGDVLRGDAELAVITLAPQQEAHIATNKVWHDPLCFAAAADHPLTKQKSLQLADLSDKAAILPNRNTYTGMIIASLFAQHKLSLTIDMATNYMETVKSMASIGLGWTVIPESMLDNELRKLPVTDVLIERELGLIHHKSRSLSNAATAFMGTLHDFADNT